MRRAAEGPPTYAEPFLWWGPVWSPPPARSLVDLLGESVLTPAVAALLWGALARRRSVIVAAGPRGVGKTTLLTALLDCLPPATRRLYLRGCYESFAFREDPTVNPADSVVLINEISAHLPAYLWGPGVRRVLQAARDGFALAATAHAATIDELIGQLAGYPLRVPLSELAAIDLVVLMAEGNEAPGNIWRVEQVWALALDSQRGLTVDLRADRGELLGTASGQRSIEWHGLPDGPEIARRAEFLVGLAESGDAFNQAQLQQALSEYAD